MVAFSPSSMMVMVAVSPFCANLPAVLREEPDISIVSSGSPEMLSSMMVNMVFLVVVGPSFSKNVTTAGAGPLKSTPEVEKRINTQL